MTDRLSKEAHATPDLPSPESIPTNRWEYAEALVRERVEMRAEIERLEAALDAFSKAVSMPGGPSLAIQRHNPSWTAWKQLCLRDMAVLAGTEDGLRSFEDVRKQTIEECAKIAESKMDRTKRSHIIARAIRDLGERAVLAGKEGA